MRSATLFIVIRLSSPFQGTIHLSKRRKKCSIPAPESQRGIGEINEKSAVLDLETAALDSP
jgi:hypothetical protein